VKLGAPGDRHPYLELGARTWSSAPVDGRSGTVDEKVMPGPGVEELEL
jgi:hypothetical protein